MDNKLIQEWMKERDAVCKTYSVTRFRAFYNKWRRRGIYAMPIPANDAIIEITMRKCVYHMKSATDAEKQEAKEWLYAHGSTTDI